MLEKYTPRYKIQKGWISIMNYPLSNRRSDYAKMKTSSLSMTFDPKSDMDNFLSKVNQYSK